MNWTQYLTPEMMRWVSLTRLISGVSRTKAALPWTCLRKLSEYSTWWSGQWGEQRTSSERLKMSQTWSHHTLAIHSTKGVAKRLHGKTHTHTHSCWQDELGDITGISDRWISREIFFFFGLRGWSIKSNKITSQSSVGRRQENRMKWSSLNKRRA